MHRHCARTRRSVRPSRPRPRQSSSVRQSFWRKYQTRRVQMAKKAVKKAAPKKSAYRGEVAKAAQALAQIETEIKEGLKVNDTSVLKLRKRIRANLNEIVQMLDRKRKNMSTQS